MVFKPTYLYIKQHSKTGKLYFGKTTKSDPLSYLGSGKHWTRHIKTHGKEHVVTLWYQLYCNPFDIVADALSMSKSFDIVNSDSWLNLIPETGLAGSIQYNNTSNKYKPQNTKGVSKSKEHTRKKLKRYEIISPCGDMFCILGLHYFCKLNNLNTGRMSQVALGKEYSHKGWRCTLLT